MVYNEQKLESFSRRAFKYEEQKIIDTHQAIRDAIDQYFDKNAVKEKYEFTPVLDVYLQGSYKNSTNVTKSSDVDLVVQMQSLWRANKESLPADQLAKYDAAHSNVSYPFEDFKLAIFSALHQFFGAGNVINDNKCLKIREHGRYCSADVVPCFTYRQYGTFESLAKQSYTEGMYFIRNDGKLVRNFPKQHYDALTTKSEATDGSFKETVRMFKNMRDDLIDKRVIYEGIAKSYYIENMLYNVPDSCFSKIRLQTFQQVLHFLIEIDRFDLLHSLKCANGIDPLISPENWNIYDAHQFLTALIKVRDETEL